MPQTEHLQPNKLPDENSLRIYMESLFLGFPYRFPRDIARSLQECIANTSGERLTMRDMLVSDLFKCKALEPEIVGSPEDAQIIQLRSKLWDQAPRQLKNIWNKLTEQTRDNFYQKISRSSDLDWSKTQRRAILIEFANEQQRILIRKLYKANLVRNQTDPEIRQEIELRRIQYPNQKIYVLVGDHLDEYFAGTQQGMYLEEAIIVKIFSSTWQNRIEHGCLGVWESAVVAQEQIRANHSLHYHYEIKRVPRWWQLQWWMYMKFSLEIDPRIEDPSLIKEGQQPLTRFSMLEA